MTGACGYDMVSDRHVGTYRLAGVAVRVESLHPDVHELCRDYRWEGEPGLVVRTFQTDIDFERGRSRDGSPGEAAPSDGYRPIDPSALLATLGVTEGIVGRVDVWRLGCDVSIEAARLSFSAMSGTEAP